MSDHDRAIEKVINKLLSMSQDEFDTVLEDSMNGDNSIRYALDPDWPEKMKTYNFKCSKHGHDAIGVKCPKCQKQSKENREYE